MRKLSLWNKLCIAPGGVKLGHGGKAFVPLLLTGAQHHSVQGSVAPKSSALQRTIGKEERRRAPQGKDIGALIDQGAPLKFFGAMNCEEPNIRPISLINGPWW